MYFLLFFLLLFRPVSIFSEISAYSHYMEEVLQKLEPYFDCLADPNNRNEIVELFLQIRLKELDHTKSYQIITAQDSRYFAYQVIAKELYVARNGGECLNDFEFLRYPSENLIKSPKVFFQSYPCLKNRSEEVSSDCIDTLSEISYQLLSGSLSIDTYIPADSALFVFLYGKGLAEWSNCKDEVLYHEKFLQNVSTLFDSAGIKKDVYQAYLHNLLEAAPKTTHGIINQIFLPVSSIENYLYMSSAGGFLNEEQNNNISQTMEVFQKLRFNDFLLKESYQVRLIAGALFDGHVNIYRYTLIPIEEQKSYRLLVKDLIHKMLDDQLQLSLYSR